MPLYKRSRLTDKQNHPTNHIDALLGNAVETYIRSVLPLHVLTIRLCISTSVISLGTDVMVADLPTGMEFLRQAIVIEGGIESCISPRILLTVLSSDLSCGIVKTH